MGLVIEMPRRLLRAAPNPSVERPADAAAHLKGRSATVLPARTVGWQEPIEAARSVR
jgi:hypothetical protein